MRLVMLLLSLLPASLSYAAGPAVEAIQTDLGITKNLVSATPVMSSATFEIIVTNHGDQDSGPFTFIDELVEGLWFDSAIPVPAPWTCTYVPAGAEPLYVACTHPGPLAVGNSVVVPLSVHTRGDAPYDNCVQLQYNGDEDPHNNEACECVTFHRCDIDPLTIDVSTGVRDFQKLPAGTPDPDWQVVREQSGASPAAAIVVAPYHSGFATTSAQWLSLTNPHSTATGTFAYTYTFALPHALAGRTCSIDLQYAADNYASIALDGTVITSQVPIATATNFTTLESFSGTFTATGGTHSLRALVGSDSGPTSFLLTGRIRCACEE